MIIADSDKVVIEYDQYMEPIKSQRPIVFQKDKLYCCISDPNLSSSISALGKTPDQALEFWADCWRKKRG